MANFVLVVIFASLAASAQGRRIKKGSRGVASDLSTDLDEAQVNATGFLAGQVCPEGYGKFNGFMPQVEALDDYLFAIFGEGLSDAPDHQFMVWQAREEGSGTYGIEVDGKWKGLDYYFVKGALCIERCTSFDPNCCVGDATNFPGMPSTALQPHGNRPNSGVKKLVLFPKLYKTSKYSPSGIGATFQFEARGEAGAQKFVAKAPTSDGADCYVQHVHVCESNMKGGKNFKPTKFDIVGKLADGKTLCLAAHT